MAHYEEFLLKFDQISDGMNPDQVLSVLNKIGNESDAPAVISTAQVPETSQLSNLSYHRYGLGISASFVNGIIFNKKFIWLSETSIPKGTARTTAAKFEQVTFGMTYEEVVALLGSPGVLWTSIQPYKGPDARVDGYVWWPQDEPENSSQHRMMIRIWGGLVDQKEFNGATETKP